MIVDRPIRHSISGSSSITWMFLMTSPLLIVIEEPPTFRSLITWTVSPVSRMLPLLSLICMCLWVSFSLLLFGVLGHLNF